MEVGSNSDEVERKDDFTIYTSSPPVAGLHQK